MTVVFLYSKWMQLPLSTKALLSKEFGFLKTGPTHVSNDRVVDDGYKLIDVENAMNLDAIVRYLGITPDNEDFTAIWDMMIAKAEGRTITVVSPPEPEKTTEAETVLVVEKETVDLLTKPTTNKKAKTK